MGSAEGESPKSTQLEDWTIGHRMISTFIIIVPISPPRKWGDYSDKDDGLPSVFTEGRIHCCRLWKHPLGDVKNSIKTVISEVFPWRVDWHLTKWAPKMRTEENIRCPFLTKEHRTRIVLSFDWLTKAQELSRVLPTASFPRCPGERSGHPS